MRWIIFYACGGTKGFICKSYGRRESYGRDTKRPLVYSCGHDDTDADISISRQNINLRIFEDENGKMNISLNDINGQLLVVSQFTLYGDCRKGKSRAMIRQQDLKQQKGYTTGC
jgi:hypothetical protein